MNRGSSITVRERQLPQRWDAKKLPLDAPRVGSRLVRDFREDRLEPLPEPARADGFGARKRRLPVSLPPRKLEILRSPRETSLVTARPASPSTLRGASAKRGEEPESRDVLLALLRSSSKRGAPRFQPRWIFSVSSARCGRVLYRRRPRALLGRRPELWRSTTHAGVAQRGRGGRFSGPLAGRPAERLSSGARFPA
jgi:hypothetical protein